MNKKPKIIILILLSTTAFQMLKKPNDVPLFFTMSQEWKEVVKEENIFEFNNVNAEDYNQVTSHTAKLLSNEKGEPILFFSDLETPVCADGECKLAIIKIYWNLLGNYVGYGIDAENPLTKYEHDPFEKEDYEILHRLLLDNHSIIGRRKMSSLIDKVPVPSSKINSKDIDGISGATKKEIKESVVQGGLYSCYTIWHLVNGEARKEIKMYLKSIHSDSLNNYFLYSDYEDYQSYALKQLTKEECNNHPEQIVKIFKNVQPITKTYILKKLPESLLVQKNVIEQLYGTFSSSDINTKTLLVEKLKLAHPVAVEILSNNLSEMTKNQLKTYLAYLSEKPEFLNKTIQSNLMEISNSKKYGFSYVIKDFLKYRE